MKVKLIYPRLADSVDKFDENSLLTEVLRRLLRLGRTNYTPPLSLLMLGAVTPPNVEVQIIDERLEDVDFDEEVDLVGITVTTRVAARAYKIAGEYRKRGVTVVLGGAHPSVLPQEAGQYADVVVIGEAEEVWPQLLADFKQGSLKRRYKGLPQADLNKLPWPRRELIRHPERYLSIKVLAATRGCPNTCTFCAGGFATGKQYRTRDVENVVAELNEVPGKYVAFVDDNLGWDINYAKKLFKAIAPLNIRWTGAVTMSSLEDLELVELMAKSGCIAISLGIESLSPQVIAEIQKQRTNDPSRYRQLLKRVHDFGIVVVGDFILGFDGDDKNTFETLVNFINETRIEIPSINTLIPYPGTPIFRQFEREGRLLHKDWTYYDTAGGYVVYQPKQMSLSELVEGYFYVADKVYSFPSLARRLIEAKTFLSFASLFAIHYNIQQRRSVSLEKKQYAGKWPSHG